MNSSKLRLPNNSQRTLIIGRTGSGKTVGALYLFSLADFLSIPWIVFDFKGDVNIARIPYAKEISIQEPVPTEPGIYIVRPHPKQETEVDNFLWQVWERGNTGLYIDEGYMIDKSSEPFQGIFTQGRSKQIPVIILSQRPVWLSRFALSESDFYMVFSLNDDRDKKTVQSFLPVDFPERLAPHHSLWYDVAENRITELKPVEPPDKIMERFERRLRPPKVLEIRSKNRRKI